MTQKVLSTETMQKEITKVSYLFEAALWKYDAPAAWYFISVPKDTSEEIRNLFQQWEEGWGRLKCEVKVGSTVWDTAIWYDSKRGLYILPLKADIRRKERIEVEDKIAVTIKI